MAYGSRRIFAAISALLSLYFLYITLGALTRAFDDEHNHHPTTGLAHSKEMQLDTVTPSLRRRHNIAVASVFAHHFDVYMALVWTLESVFRHDTTRNRVRVFAEPFHFGFPRIVDHLALYHGKLSSPDALVLEMWESSNGDPIDMVILGTCEVDLPRWHQELLDAWDARDATHKFQLVCMVHNVEDKNWQSRIPEWSRRGAFRVLTIADHVADSFKSVFNGHADSPDPSLYTAGYEHIHVDVHVPVLDVRPLPHKVLNRKLSKATIQGSFSLQRRDYEGIFNDLIASLHDDPTAWGYIPTERRDTFIPDPLSEDPPFQLLLVGSGGIQIPTELEYLVTVHRDLEYDDFYALIAETDIIVPAFAQFGYYEAQASSTIALAVELEVPILATQRMRQTYGYIDDDRAVVTRPAAMREVHALKALRTGNASFFLESDPAESGFKISTNIPLTMAVEKMVRSGWTRDHGSYKKFKEELWEKNKIVVEHLLRDV